LIEDLDLAEAVPFRAWWREPGMQALSPVERFGEFVDQILLERIASPILVFVEEVDNLLSLSFDTDGFFGMIRALHERRAEHPAYQRLSFFFLEVATPYDLIRSGHRSAFNIGHALELSGLERQEATPLLEGLTGKVADPPAVLDAVLQWSGGQPFLTQKLLALVGADAASRLAASGAAAAERPAELVAAVAQETDHPQLGGSGFTGAPAHHPRPVAAGRGTPPRAPARAGPEDSGAWRHSRRRLGFRRGSFRGLQPVWHAPDLRSGRQHRAALECDHWPAHRTCLAGPYGRD
jgi:hypothetical protein